MMDKQQIQSIILRNQFDTIYQPIVEIQTNQIFGYESLTRLRGEEKISIAHFINDCRTYRLLKDFEWQAFHNALLRFPTNANTSLFINLSYNTFLERFAAIYEKLQETPHKVVFEFLETALVNDMQKEELNDKMNLLDDRFGTQFAIDDFGAGFANIARVLSQPAKFVKTDVALLRDIEYEKEKQRVLANLFLFLKRNNRELIVEGVEKEGQLRFLKDLGVRLAQGYYFE
ncbi:EAL domain-containing protein [Listeria valentina]|uniref:EAL domain-containing protein n=1 Tax=Listeria valentina TaxID=2705293 RepID=UPI001FE26B8C|nr:EAL domain-containing protein [Listeria valentina]